MIISWIEFKLASRSLFFKVDEAMPALDCWKYFYNDANKICTGDIFSETIRVRASWFCDAVIKSSFKSRIIVVVYAMHDIYMNRLISFVYCPVFFLFSELFRSISCRLTVGFGADIFVRDIICVSRDINFVFNLKYNLALCHFRHGTFVNQKSLVETSVKV